MYKLLLISKYLRRKLAPLFAALAVTICTAMVVIVISVMGGFLDLMRTTAKTLTGDVIVETGSLASFPHYEELIERIEALDEAELATPVVSSFSLMKIGNQSQVVQIQGVDMAKMSQIINYEDTLLWTGQDWAGAHQNVFSDHATKWLAREIDLRRAGMTLTEPKILTLLNSHAEQDRFRTALLADKQLRASFLASPAFPQQFIGDPQDPDGSFLRVLEQPISAVIMARIIVEDPTLLDLPGMPTLTPQPAAVIGVEVNPYQRRDKNGQYHYVEEGTNLPVSFAGEAVDITLAPMSPRGDIGSFEPVRRRITVANEFKSGFYEIDKSRVYVPIGWLQQQLQMQRSEDLDAATIDPITGLGGEPVITPARVHEVWVKAAPGYSADELAAAVEGQILALREDHPDLPFIQANTWEQKHAPLLGAVQNEKGLVTFLFVIISIVAIVMVATTFYMIVLEKTRDIGVLRAIGASSIGVLNLFLAYGLVIGIIGAAAGVALAWFTVTNLNNLQDALATRMATLIGSVTITFLIALLGSIALAWTLRKRDFGLGGGVMVFLSIWVLLLAVLYYAFPMLSLPIASGLDTQIGWRMWNPQTYFFERIPDKVNPREALRVGIGAVISSVLGAVIPALIAARLNPVEALRYE